MFARSGGNSGNIRDSKNIDLGENRNFSEKNEKRNYSRNRLTLTGREGGVWQGLSMRVWMRVTRWNGRRCVRMRRCRGMKNVRSCRICDGADVTTGSGGGQLLPQPGSSVAEPHLDPSLGQLRSLGQFFPGVDVRVLGPLECSFQFV